MVDDDVHCFLLAGRRVRLATSEPVGGSRQSKRRSAATREVGRLVRRVTKDEGRASHWAGDFDGLRRPATLTRPAHETCWRRKDVVNYSARQERIVKSAADGALSRREARGVKSNPPARRVGQVGEQGREINHPSEQTMIS